MQTAYSWANESCSPLPSSEYGDEKYIQSSICYSNTPTERGDVAWGDGSFSTQGSDPSFRMKASGVASTLEKAMSAPPFLAALTSLNLEDRQMQQVRNVPRLGK